MDSLNSQHLSTPERQEILEHLYEALRELIAGYCPQLNKSQTDTYLRDIDFCLLDANEREIFRDMIPDLAGLLLPPEADKPGTLPNSFLNDLNFAENSAGGLDLIGTSDEPVTEEYLLSQAAVLRTNALFVQHVCNQSCDDILRRRIAFTIAEIIIKTGYTLPANIRNALSKNELDLLHTMQQLAASGEQLRRRESEQLIEQTIQDLRIPQALSPSGVENIIKIRKAVSDSIWQAWEQKEKSIQIKNKNTFLAMRHFLMKHSEFSWLIPWLIGERN